MGLRFGLVLDSVGNRDVPVPTAATSDTGGDKELGGTGLGQLSRGISQTMWCHVQHIKLGKRKERWE